MMKIMKIMKPELASMGVAPRATISPVQVLSRKKQKGNSNSGGRKKGSVTVKYKAEAVATFPATDAGKESSVEAAATAGGFDYGAPTGALKSRDGVKVLSCLSHPDCVAKMKVLFTGDEYVVFESCAGHNSETRLPPPKNFKGVSAEFKEEVDKLVMKGRTPQQIQAALIVGCNGDEAKKQRVPKTVKIAARRVTLLKTPALRFDTFADLQEWANSEMVTTREEFESVTDLDKLLVLRTFHGTARVKDESEGAADGAMIEVPTFGIVFSSKRVLLQLKQVLFDRNGKPIAIMVDGTYRLLSVDGKTWPMINGGPCLNYYSGPAGKTEYSTSVIDCLFLFCKVECEEAYRVYFETLKNIVVTLFDLPPLDPAVVGSDRAKAIVNAAAAVFPRARCVLCWPHVSRYITEGKFAKHMSGACTAEQRGRMEADIAMLHQCRSQDMFDFIAAFMFEVWTAEGEGVFVAYFRRHYATGVWSRWWYGAALEAGVPANQNALEIRHSKQKGTLGASLLQACPRVMIGTCAPLLLAAEGASNAQAKKWPATLQVPPRLSAIVAAKARIVAQSLQTIQPTEPLAENWPEHEGAPAILVGYVNSYEKKFDEVTSERVKAYAALCRGQAICRGKSTRKKLEKVKGFATGLHCVKVFKVDESRQSPWLRKQRGVGDVPEEGAGIGGGGSDDNLGNGGSDDNLGGGGGGGAAARTFLLLKCDCEENHRSGGSICSCSLAVATEKYGAENAHINLELLLQSTASTRRGVGRPRVAGPGNAWGGGDAPSSAPVRSTPHFYLSQIRDKGALYFHKWRVVKEFSGTYHTGTIISYRKDFCEERRPYTSSTPCIVLWKCRFGDFIDEDTGEPVIEEYNDVQLSTYLSAAHLAGCSGPAAADQPANQLLAIPTAVIGQEAPVDSLVDSP